MVKVKGGHAIFSLPNFLSVRGGNVSSSPELAASRSEETAAAEAVNGGSSV